VQLAAGDEQARFVLELDRDPRDAAKALPVSLTVLDGHGATETAEAEMLPV
jgi:hypothetical protein